MGKNNTFTVSALWVYGSRPVISKVAEHPPRPPPASQLARHHYRLIKTVVLFQLNALTQC